METMEMLQSLSDSCERLDDRQDRQAREVMGFVANSWALWVVFVLGGQGRLRFSRLREQVEGISQKMLTKTLRQLEANGLVARTMYLEVPPRVEYELTPLGGELLAQVTPLWNWVATQVDRFVPTPVRRG
jgi:DNA-binding HxlR family transcriptional regulator